MTNNFEVTVLFSGKLMEKYVFGSRLLFFHLIMNSEHPVYSGQYVMTVPYVSTPGL